MARTRTTWTKGDPRNKGRRAGTPNRLTASCREAIELAAQLLGGSRRLARWARSSKRNEYAFWTVIYPKLLPVSAYVTGALIPPPTADAREAVAEIAAQLDRIADARNIAAPAGNGHDSDGSDGGAPLAEVGGDGQ
jgi:hypothetical protein